ncbi:MAG: hypothetical protein ACRD5F_05545, partial [Candidatus Acidiferrales bacterium]
VPMTAAEETRMRRKAAYEAAQVRKIYEEMVLKKKSEPVVQIGALSDIKPIGAPPVPIASVPANGGNGKANGNGHTASGNGHANGNSSGNKTAPQEHEAPVAGD